MQIEQSSLILAEEKPCLAWHQERWAKALPPRQYRHTELQRDDLLTTGRGDDGRAAQAHSTALDHTMPAQPAAPDASGGTAGQLTTS